MRSITAVFLGGLAAFIWSSISWMVLPWHQPTMSVFENEEAFGIAIREAAPAAGIYTWPGWTDDQEDMKKKHEEGPYVFASVVPAGVGTDMTGMMVGGLLISILGAVFLMTLMRLGAPDFNWKARFLVGAVAALFVSLLPALLNLNWWHFAPGFTIVAVVDNFIAWTLAALLVAMIDSPGKEPASEG